MPEKRVREREKNKLRSGKSRWRKSKRDGTEAWECPGEEPERTERQKLRRLLSATLLTSNGLNRSLPDGGTLLKISCNACHKSDLPEASQGPLAPTLLNSLF